MLFRLTTCRQKHAQAKRLKKPNMSSFQSSPSHLTPVSSSRARICFGFCWRLDTTHYHSEGYLLRFIYYDWLKIGFGMLGGRMIGIALPCFLPGRNL
jgi:hypothetical protein